MQGSDGFREGRIATGCFIDEPNSCCIPAPLSPHPSWYVEECGFSSAVWGALLSWGKKLMVTLLWLGSVTSRCSCMQEMVCAGGAVPVLLCCGSSWQGLEALGRAMGRLEVGLSQVGGFAGCLSQASFSHEVVLWDRGLHRVITAGIYGTERSRTCGFGSRGAALASAQILLRRKIQAEGKYPSDPIK